LLSFDLELFTQSFTIVDYVLLLNFPEQFQPRILCSALSSRMRSTSAATGPRNMLLCLSHISS